MYYLWIDPWIRKLWYWIIDDDNNIIDAWIILIDQKFPTRQDYFNRIHDIYNYFQDLIKKYKIKNVWIEKLFFTEFNKSNAEFVYWIRWVLISLFIQNKINIFEYTPKEIKKYITWNWNAEKILVQQFIMKIFWLKDLPKYNDAADALGLAFIVSKK
jgi:crossover junction endodeoxyribonuclease RuvC